MKTFFKILIAIVITGAVAGYVYWQLNKNKIIRDSIKSTVHTKTEKLYSIHYDSSLIDEINGNASFYKVSMQPDSAQRELLKSTNNLPNALFTISVEEVSARGIDMIGLLQKESITAKSIVLKKPLVQITNTGIDKPKPFTYDDTLELYQKMLGKFKSIHADSINVVDGTLLITDIKGKPLTTLENINITLKNFLIDSTRDYHNIVSYFIKDVKVTVENMQLPEAENGTRVNITKLLYNAPEKILHVGSIQQYQSGNITPVTEVKNVYITQLNTDAFILHQQLKAGLVTCDGGLITIYRRTKKKLSGQATVELSSSLIDEAQVDGVQLGNTKIIVVDPAKPGEAAFIINDVKFSAAKIVSVTEGSTISDIINSAEWQLSAGSFSFFTKEKFYKFSADGMLLDNKSGTVKIAHILLKPSYTEEQFVSIVKVQKDRYDLSFNNIDLKGVNFKRMINDNILEVETAALQPVIKIFNDQTLPEAPNTNVAKYPQQSILELGFKFYVKNIIVNNGAVFYKERGEDSKMIGIPSFTNINATIKNVTNLPERIKENSTLNLKASTLFLNIAQLSTEWALPLNPLDTVFKVSGKLGPIDATKLNQISEPLGMVSVKSGIIKSLLFDLQCNNYKGQGKATLLYNHLKIEVLKRKNDRLKKKGLLTFLANTLIKNDNPGTNYTYVSDINYNRDRYSSFFNLIWKCILDGAEKTVLRK